MSAKSAYTVPVVCGNCGLDRRVDIPTGVPVHAQPCPSCGCKTLLVRHEAKL